jgi:hypothetical protein
MSRHFKAGLNQLGPRKCSVPFWKPTESTLSAYRRRQNKKHLSQDEMKRVNAFREQHGIYPDYRLMSKKDLYVLKILRANEGLSSGRRNKKKPTLPKLKFMDDEGV